MLKRIPSSKFFLLPLRNSYRFCADYAAIFLPSLSPSSTYVSLLGQSEPDLKISLQAGQKPDSVVLVKAGSDKEAYIKALCSQLSIAPDVARELLAGIPDSRNIASKGDQ
jgi:hypothetical protein